MKFLDRIMKSLVFISCIIYGLMAFVIGFNVVGRLLFKHPIKGTVEIVEIMMVFIGFFSIAFTTQNRSHVTVRIFLHHLPVNIQKKILSIGFLLSSIIIGIITYQSILNTIYYTLHLEQTTSLLFIPLAPLKFIMVLGCGLIFIFLYLDFLHLMVNNKDMEGNST